jgi:hypothetical protein
MAPVTLGRDGEQASRSHLGDCRFRVKEAAPRQSV